MRDGDKWYRSNSWMNSYRQDLIAYTVLYSEGLRKIGNITRRV
jgi:hypothetical protein